MVKQAKGCPQKTFCGKAVEALPAILGSVSGAILCFLAKAVGLLAEHRWALIVFVAGLSPLPAINTLV